MNDIEMSKALALAIGWREEDLVATASKVLACVYDDSLAEGRYWWQVFDYRDWNVIGPIAAKYDAFPMKSVVDGEWHASCDGDDMNFVYGDTPQKAIALTVIQGAKK